MASKKKPKDWQEGDEVALHGTVSKVWDSDGRERIVVQLKGFGYPITVDQSYVHPQS